MTSEESTGEPTAGAESLTSSEQKSQSTASQQEISLELQTENLIETYHALAEWIRFADAKAAVVLTIGAAAAGLLTPTLKGYLAIDPALHLTPWWTNLVWGLFGAGFVSLLISLAYAFWCLLPFRLKGEHPARERCAHFHPVGIATKYRIDQHDAFVEGYKQGGLIAFEKEVLAGLLIDAHISQTKYRRVTRAIRWLSVSTFFALAYLVAIQL